MKAAPHTLLTLAASLLLTGPLFAELAVDPIYSSHMVLQRGKTVPISGTCTGSKPVVVSFAGQQVRAKVKGNIWQANLEPMEAQAEGSALTVTQGKESVTLDDVVVGEVWIASGQSNMFWRLVETRDKAALQAPENPAFRFYHSEPKVETPRRAYTDEQCDILKSGKLYQGSWSVSSPESSRRMSAVGWYFGRKLQQELGVPVGIIHASLGGSEMLAWIPKSVVKKKYPQVLGDKWMHDKMIDPFWVRPRALLNLGDRLNIPHPYRPGYLYEAGIAPWAKFPVKGVIWYQGESDAAIPNDELNRKVLTDLITSWREAFHNPELAFCMVQLPRIKDPAPVRALWAEFREVQSRVSRELPQVYCANTIDLGTTNHDVHPPRKLEVGERLAALAATQVYGLKDIPYSGPTLSRAELADGQVVLHFDHAKGLSTTNGAAPACFELSADGKTYHPAEAELAGETVKLRSAEVETPRFVRYAWAVFVEPNLVNADKLPPSPFSAKIPSSQN